MTKGIPRASKSLHLRNIGIDIDIDVDVDIGTCLNQGIYPKLSLGSMYDLRHIPYLKTFESSGLWGVLS